MWQGLHEWKYLTSISYKSKDNLQGLDKFLWISLSITPIWPGECVVFYWYYYLDALIKDFEFLALENFHTQIEHLFLFSIQRIFFLYHLFCNLFHRTFFSIRLPYFIPLLGYCSFVWALLRLLFLDSIEDSLLALKWMELDCIATQGYRLVDDLTKFCLNFYLFILLYWTFKPGMLFNLI